MFRHASHSQIYHIIYIYAHLSKSEKNSNPKSVYSHSFQLKKAESVCTWLKCDNIHETSSLYLIWWQPL